MTKPATAPADTSRLNSLTDMLDGVFAGNNAYTQQTISQPFTLAESNSYTPVTLNRILLSYSYMSQGLIQTVVRQPVDDAFRGGIGIKSKELDSDELATLGNTLRRSRSRSKFHRQINPNAAINRCISDLQAVMDTLAWARLYGGAGLIVNTDQDFRTPLDIEAIGPDTPLEFIAADRWELILSQTNIWDERQPTPFNFYGLPLNRTRVIKVLGVEAPSYIRLRLQGWGMSEIERCIRPINSFCKFENLVFELLDEAKIDVYKIQGFNDALLTDDGTANAQKRILLSNRLKNFQNALAMDVEDEYMQKQLSFSGLAELWNEIRLNLSSALKIPMNKLFGQSASGFSSGEDAIENYNSIVEQIRLDAEPLLQEVIDLRCQQLFGFIPEYELEWQPLKVLNGEEEQAVKTSQQNRVMQMFQQRLITGFEASRILKDEHLLQIDTEVSEGLRDVDPMDMVAEQGPKGSPSKEDKKAEKKPDKKPGKK